MRPVLIVGEARSGSSILYRLIQEHPAFLPAAGINLSESRILNVLSATTDLDAVSLRAFAQLEGERWADCRESMGARSLRSRLRVRTPDPILRRSVHAWSALGGAHALREYFSKAHENRGAVRLVEKTPTHGPWTAHVLHVFKDARILSIHRDPVDVLASHRRRALIDGHQWADLAPEEIARQWRTGAQRSFRMASRHPERYKWFRYEDLITAPERTAGELFRWLGESPPTILPGSIEPHPDAPMSDAARLYGPIERQEFDTSLVAEDEARILRHQLRAELISLGYDGVSDDRAC